MSSKVVLVCQVGGTGMSSRWYRYVKKVVPVCQVGGTGMSSRWYRYVK